MPGGKRRSGSRRNGTGDLSEQSLGDFGRIAAGNDLMVATGVAVNDGAAALSTTKICILLTLRTANEDNGFQDMREAVNIGVTDIGTSQLIEG